MNNIEFSFVILNLTLHKFNGKSFQSLILINLYLISSVKTVISQLKDERGFALQYCQESDRYLLKEKKRKSLTRWSTPTPLDKKEQNTIHHIKKKKDKSLYY